MAQTPNDLMRELLRDVSRSFYLTLRVIPKTIRPQIGLAYLLARTTDTIADTELVSLEKRLESLEALRGRILENKASPIDFGELAGRQQLPAERLLLEKCETSLALLQTLSSADLQLVREVLDTIVGGQELDLRRFAGASKDNIVALQTEAELDDYTYRVAGCVGEFWTKMCSAHLFPGAQFGGSFLLASGVRFGKGLQLVNILRDLPADLRHGRCYLPAEELSRAGLIPQDLLEPGNEAKLRPLYHQHLDLAEAHLAAGWAYTNALPWRGARVRLACAWPILIGMKTIERLRAANALDPQRVKISRTEVRQIILRSVFLYPWPGAWQKMAFPQKGKAVASKEDFK
jgi:farnesyl-diphosphate farnesyltransferase